MWPDDRTIVAEDGPSPSVPLTGVAKLIVELATCQLQNAAMTAELERLRAAVATWREQNGATDGRTTDVA